MEIGCFLASDLSFADPDLGGVKYLNKLLPLHVHNFSKMLLIRKVLHKLSKVLLALHNI